MARQEDTCWSCEAAWDQGSARPNVVRVIPDGHAARLHGGGQPSAPAVIGETRLVAQATLDVGRWADEGVRLAVEGSRRVEARIAAVQ